MFAVPGAEQIDAVVLSRSTNLLCISVLLSKQPETFEGYIQLLKRTTGHDLVLEWMRHMAATVARTSPDSYGDFAWKVQYPILYSAIRSSGVQLGAGAGKQNVASSSINENIYRGALAAVQPAQLPYERAELCVPEMSVHFSVLPSIMISQPAMVAPFPAILEEIKTAVLSEHSAYKAAVMAKRHDASADVPIQPLFSACRKGIMTIRSKIAKPLEQQRVLWRGVTEAALAFGWCHEDGEVKGKSFALRVLASKNPDYADKYSNTGDVSEVDDEVSSFKRRRGVADKEMVCGYKATFSTVMNDVYEHQNLKKFKKLMSRLSDQRIGDMLKTEENPAKSLKGIHAALCKHHTRLKAIYRYYCRLGSNTAPGEKPISYLGNVSLSMCSVAPAAAARSLNALPFSGKFYKLV